MRLARDRSAEIALGVALAAMLAVRAIHPSPIGAWQRLTGAVVPNGTATTSYAEAPIRLLSVTGDRWVTRSRKEPASAYHVLFLDPARPMLHMGWESNATPFSFRVRDRWVYGDDGPREPWFESRYNPLLQSVEIGGRRYWLARGNVFVVRADHDGKPRVKQLHAHVRAELFGTAAQDQVFVEAARVDAEVRRALRDLQTYRARAKNRCGWRPGAVKRAMF